MKLKLLIVACFAVVCLMTFSARLLTSQASAQGQKLPGDNLVMPSVDEKWGQVKFTHQKHLAYSDCAFCHHTNKGVTLESFKAKPEKIPLCAECHVRKEGDAKTPKNGEGTELWSKEAYHANCIECHQGEIKHKPKDSGVPKKLGDGGTTKCAECHEKKE
jgi:hypothetical protein